MRSAVCAKRHGRSVVSRVRFRGSVILQLRGPSPSVRLGMTATGNCCLFQARRRGNVALKLENHPANVAIALVRLEQAQALLRIAPTQNLDVLFARPPGIHRASRRHIKIDRVPSRQGPSVIFDAINLPGRDQAKDSTGRPARPIRRRTSNLRFCRHYDFLRAVLCFHELGRFRFLERKFFERRPGIGSPPIISRIVAIHRNGARSILSATNSAGRGMQLPTERILTSVGQMIRLRMRIRCRPHILKVALRQGRLVFGKGGRSGMSGRGLARAQNKRANRGTKKKEIRPVTQSRWLLTVIHNPMQEYFFNNNLGITTR
jgi:hypothetical protein